MTKENLNEKEEAVICDSTSDPGVSIELSEEAASRIAWIMTACIGILTLPFVILAVMMA